VVIVVVVVVLVLVLVLVVVVVVVVIAAAAVVVFVVVDVFVVVCNWLPASDLSTFGQEFHVLLDCDVISTPAKQVTIECPNIQL
jgi:hypothetical protein